VKNPIREAKYGYYRDDNRPSVAIPRTLTELYDENKLHTWTWRGGQNKQVASVVDLIAFIRNCVTTEGRNFVTREFMRDDGFSCSASYAHQLVSVAFKDQNLYIVKALEIPIPRFM
jgi:hypothetical protein